MPASTIRLQIVIGGVATSDVCDTYPSVWRAIGDTLALGGYAYRLRDFVRVDGWLQYTASDGTTIRAIQA